MNLSQGGYEGRPAGHGGEVHEEEDGQEALQEGRDHGGKYPGQGWILRTTMYLRIMRI